MALFSENYGTIRVRKWLFNRGYRCNTHSDPKNPLDQVFDALKVFPQTFGNLFYWLSAI